MRQGRRAVILIGVPLLLCGMLCSLPACSGRPKVHGAAEVLESEAVLEALRSPLQVLSKSILNLRFPDPQSHAVFASTITTVDLERSQPLDWQETRDLAIRQSSWPISTRPRSGTPTDLFLWNDFLGTVEFFHHFNFYNIRGSFLNDEKSKYGTRTGFKGLAQLASGKIRFVKGQMDVVWNRAPGESYPDGETWLISELATDEFRLMETDRTLFTDVLHSAIPAGARPALLRSRRDENLINWILALRSD
ncbi:MAG: hypothetical protein V3U86_03170, partial [Acidobacteriota bacterium]